jgi:hypothetical protein
MSCDLYRIYNSSLILSLGDPSWPLSRVPYIYMSMRLDATSISLHQSLVLHSQVPMLPFPSFHVSNHCCRRKIMYKDTLPLCEFRVINDNPYRLIFHWVIWRIFHRQFLLSMYCLQVWIPWRYIYTLIIGIKIIDVKKGIWYDQEEEIKMEFLCGTKLSDYLAYVFTMDDQTRWTIE